MFSKDYFVPVLCVAAAEIKRPWNIVFFFFTFCIQEQNPCGTFFQLLQFWPTLILLKFSSMSRILLDVKYSVTPNLVQVERHRIPKFLRERTVGSQARLPLFLAKYLERKFSRSKNNKMFENEGLKVNFIAFQSFSEDF